MILMELVAKSENVMKYDCGCLVNNSITQIKRIATFVMEWKVLACRRPTIVNVSTKIQTFKTRIFLKILIFTIQTMYELSDVPVFYSFTKSPFDS